MIKDNLCTQCRKEPIDPKALASFCTYCEERAQDIENMLQCPIGEFEKYLEWSENKRSETNISHKNRITIMCHNCNSLLGMEPEKVSKCPGCLSVFSNGKIISETNRKQSSGYKPAERFGQFIVERIA